MIEFSVAYSHIYHYVMEHFAFQYVCTSANAVTCPFHTQLPHKQWDQRVIEAASMSFNLQNAWNGNCEHGSCTHSSFIERSSLPL